MKPSTDIRFLSQGELLALRWRDVDWKAGKIRVRRNYVRGHWVAPKSRRGSRSVPLADQVADELRHHFERSAYRADDDPYAPLLSLPGVVHFSTGRSGPVFNRR